ncbi:11464_t:CDS:2, partial [Cetraspora pellucida]
RAKKAGIKKNITPHTFRHSSVQTTEKYIQYDWATVHADYCRLWKKEPEVKSEKEGVYSELS